MKRGFKYVLFSLIVIYGVLLLVFNWNAYKIFFFEIGDNLFRSEFERMLERNNYNIKMRPNDPWSYIYRGSTYKENMMYEESLNDYIRAFELGGVFSIPIYISNDYLAMGDAAKAYEYINKYFEKAPYPETGLFDLAIIYDYEWKSKEAIDAYTQYIEQNNMKKAEKRYVFSLKRRALHYMLLGKYDEASSDIEIVISKNRKDKDAKKLRELLSKPKDMNDPKIKDMFKVNVYEAIVETTRIDY